MSCTIDLPKIYMQELGLQDKPVISASNLEEVFNFMKITYPSIFDQLFDSTGSAKQYVAIFLNGKNIRDLSISNKLIEDDSIISFMIPIAGG